MIKINKILIESSFEKVWLSIETLKEELKVSEKLEFENRDNPKKQLFLEILDNQELGAWMQSNGSPMKSSSTSVMFLIQALMEEIKPVLAEKKV